MDMGLLTSALLFIVGLGILIKGSDLFVSSAAYIAKHFGVSQLIIGLTLVSMGTSFPELGASMYASATGNGGIAIGNVVGSNIANIALVLGVCLMLRQIKVKKKMLTRDGMIMISVSLLFTLFIFMGGEVNRWEGLILMGIFIAYLMFLYKQNKSEKKARAINRVIEESIEKDMRFTDDIAKVIIEDKNSNKNQVRSQPTKKEEKPISLVSETLKLTIGCFGVVIGAMLLVDNAIFIAEKLGITQSVIGSTLVAFGTSVPELAVSIVAILKRYEQISIGNIIGSNIFNILLVIGASALVNPLVMESEDYVILMNTNIPIMLMVAAVLLLFMAVKQKLLRWEGAVFVTIYGVFLTLNYWIPSL
ncbi:MAG: calcium/sodium antiporter [Thermoplasmata archaeon]|nr:MAG: calcium/sodium antiporter [Thermoplasmata archaeon]